MTLKVNLSKKFLKNILIITNQYRLLIESHLSIFLMQLRLEALEQKHDINYKNIFFLNPSPDNF